MADVVRYGIIGTGLMGLEHMRYVAMIEGAEVTAYADPDAGSRRKASETSPGAEEYEDHRDLLRKAPIDAVVVASPNHTHAEVLEPVFETGLHALVEKPLCTTVDDARDVAERAARHPGLFQVGMEYRYKPPLARLIEEVRAGAAGRLHMVSIREHRFPFLPKVGDWNRFARNTGGTLVEKCCHFFDLMRLILRAEPLRVYASGAQDVNHLDEEYDGEVPDILDNAFVIVDFAGGARALLDLCMFAEASRLNEEVVATGDLGKVECHVLQSRVYRGTRRPFGVEKFEVPVEERLRRAGGHLGATYYEHQAFLRSIREGRLPEVTADDGLRAVAMGVAAEQSIVEGRPVEMDEVL